MIIKSSKELRILIIGSISLLILLVLVMTAFVGIIVYCITVVGIDPVLEHGIAAFLLLICLFFLWVYSCFIVTKIDMGDDEIRFVTLFRSIDTDALSIKIKKNTDSFLLLKVISRESVKNRYYLVLKKHYKKEDITRLLYYALYR